MRCGVKKTFSLLLCLLFGMILLLPLGKLAEACIGYRFVLNDVTAFSAATAAVSAAAVILDRRQKPRLNHRLFQILMALLPPLSLLSAAFCIFACSRASAAACVSLSAGCCCYLSIKHGNPKVLQIIALCLFALMLFPIALFSLFALTFGSIRQNTVVQTVESPGGIYYAEVVASDQGALGGDTAVNVWEQGSGIDAGIFKIEKEPRCVYLGEWYEYENMQIYWKDDECLVINSVEYPVSAPKQSP